LDTQVSANSSNRGTILALIVGSAFAAATLEVGPIALLSSNKFIGVLQTGLTILLVPGVCFGAIFDHLWIGVIINGLFYFGLAKSIYWFATGCSDS
jgi:hypothetical protein